MLSLLIYFPLIAAMFVAGMGARAGKIALGLTLIELIISLIMLSGFNPANGFQFLQNISWISTLGISYKVGIDGISLLLVLLTTFLVPVIILSSLNKTYSNPGLFYSLILIMQFALVGVFSALDGFLFYVFWELALIPIYLICLMWGGKERLKITLKFFIYTLAGSLLMLVALIWLWYQTPGTHTFDIDALYSLKLTSIQQTWIFWAFFIAFAIKMPVFPFHTWQPDTYVDSPTPGTMLLSGIMLKMGIYGVMRWLLPVVPQGMNEWGFTAIILSVIGIIYASCIAIVQKDFKRLIAYSSIAHVGLISAGILSLTHQGLHGGVIQMISHGIVVVGLFYIADILQSRTETREMNNLGGIRNVAPQFSTYFFIIILASVALPLTSGFVGEFLLLNGIFHFNPVIAGIAGVSIILGAVYMFKAFQKISLGETNSLTNKFTDLQMHEKLVMFPLIILIFCIGIYPEPILRIAGPSVEALQKTILHSLETSMIK
jgi:NADH-quinone oxidoreductase subunit M